MTEAEERFAGSIEGRAALAAARRTHDMRERHKGPAALPFTDADAVAVIRDAMAQQARRAVSREALKQGALVRTLDAINARAARDAAKADRNARLSRRHG